MHAVQAQPIQINSALKDALFDPSLSEAERKTLLKNIPQQDTELVEKEITQLKKFAQGASSILGKIGKSEAQCNKSIEVLQKESSELDQKIQAYQISLNTNTVKNVQSEIQTNKKKYISLWEERIAISEQLNTEKLRSVEIEDRKSIANELFKWAIVVIYGENESKYYLPNLQEQLFEKDNGKDFRERLGKINAAHAKDEQLHKARDFLDKYSEIIQCEELQNVKTEAETFKKVAQIFLQCHELAKKSEELEKSIENDKQKTLEQDDEAMKWKARHEALQERVQVLNQYLSALRNTENQLKEQEKVNQNKLSILEQIKSKLKKGQILTERDLDPLYA